VECKSPKYAKGNYDYTKLEDVYNFLVGIKGFPKGDIGNWLLKIAKDGRIDGVYIARYAFEVKSDFHNYALAQKIAKETGLTRAFYRVSPKLEKALAFAKAFDKEAK
jgi:hypothetical protein